MPAPETKTTSETPPSETPPAETVSPPQHPASVTISWEQMEAIKKALDAKQTGEALMGDMGAMKEMALKRGLESEARLKAMAEVQGKESLRAARIEKNLAAWLMKQGHKYE